MTLHAMYVWQVKPQSEARHQWDVFERISTIPSPDAYPSASQFGCPLVPA